MFALLAVVNVECFVVARHKAQLAGIVEIERGDIVWLFVWRGCESLEERTKCLAVLLAYFFEHGMVLRLRCKGGMGQGILLWVESLRSHHKLCRMVASCLGVRRWP